MANSGSFNTNAYEVRYLTFEWQVANQNVSTNQTTIHWILRGNGNNPNTWYMSGNFKVVIEGSTVYQSATRIQLTGTKQVASGQFTLTHHSDGNKSFSASVEAGIYYFAVNSRGSGSWALPTIARATQPTLSKTNLVFGDTIVIHTPRAASTFTHTIQAGVDGKLSWTNIATNVATSYTWTLPKWWARYLTHATDKLKFNVLTYSAGQLIGTREATPVSVTATSDMAPVVSVVLSDANNHLNTYGGFVKGKSKIRAVVTERLYEQAVVSSRSLLLNSITYQSSDQTSEVITSTMQRVEARVTDSRGLTGTKVMTPVVYDWHEPKITSVRANRCQANGTLDETGGYIKLEYACAVAPVNNRNTKTLSYRYRQQNQSQSTAKTITMESYNKTGHVIIPASGEYSWEVTVILQDAFTTSQVNVSVGTSFVLLDFHHSGKGIGIGKVAELQNTLDLAQQWDIKYKNAVIQDFIMEQGSKDGWQWRKWYSGKVECFRKLAVKTSVKNTWGNLHTSGALRVTNLAYPLTLIEIPTVYVTLSCDGWGGFLMVPGGEYRPTITHTGYFEIARGTPADNAYYHLNYHIIGKWKN